MLHMTQIMSQKIMFGLANMVTSLKIFIQYFADETKNNYTSSTTSTQYS
jgi:hypothetical protein